MKAIFTALTIVLMASSSFAASRAAVQNFSLALKYSVADLSKSKDITYQIVETATNACGESQHSLVAVVSDKSIQASNNGNSELPAFSAAEVTRFSVAVVDAETLSTANLSRTIVAKSSCDYPKDEVVQY